MSDANPSRTFLTSTLPAIIGPGVLLLVALGIWRLSALTEQVDVLNRDTSQIPQLTQSVSSYGSQLATLTAEVAALRTLTQGMDGSLRPDGTLSAEMTALQAAVAVVARQDSATRDQLNELIQALARSGRVVPGKPKAGDD